LILSIGLYVVNRPVPLFTKLLLKADLNPKLIKNPGFVSLKHENIYYIYSSYRRARPSKNVFATI